MFARYTSHRLLVSSIYKVLKRRKRQGRERESWAVAMFLGEPRLVRIHCLPGNACLRTLLYSVKVVSHLWEACCWQNGTQISEHRHC